MMKTGDKWIFGKPFLTVFFTTVDINNKQITFSEVSAIEKNIPGAFDTIRGWSFLALIIVLSIISYLIGSVIVYICHKQISKENDITLLEEKYKNSRKIKIVEEKLT